jgi:hypothetical protein
MSELITAIATTLSAQGGELPVAHDQQYIDELSSALARVMREARDIQGGITF